MKFAVSLDKEKIKYNNKLSQMKWKYRKGIL